jgi:hypothetical protein
VRRPDGQNGVPVELLLDDKPLERQGIGFDDICVGHGRPVLKTWLWNCFRPALSKPGYPLACATKAGDHVLTRKTSPGAYVLWEGFVVTDDLGFAPEGTVDFLVRPD